MTIYLRSQDSSTNLLPLALLVAVFAMTVKISALPLIVLPVLIWVKDKMIPRRSGLVALLLIPWGIRGILLSGCLAYPIQASCLPVAWRVPKKAVEEEAAWIRSWARLPGENPDEVLSTNAWLKPWLANAATMPEVFASLALLIPGILNLAVLPRRLSGAYIAIALMPIAGLAFWFFTAPDLRFGQGYIWSLPLIILALVSEKLWRKMPPKAAWLLLVVLLPLIVNSANQTIWPDIPSADTQVQFTTNGEVVFVPIETDQCWLSALPCTPYLSRNLIIEPTSRTVFIPESQTSKPPN